MKIRPGVSQILHADRQTDRYDEDNSRFSQLSLTIHTFPQLFTFCVAAILLCVLQTAVGSLQSPDCDTEWLIGVNVVTGGVLCVLQTAVGSLQSPDCDTEWLIGVNVVTGGILCGN